MAAGGAIRAGRAFVELFADDKKLVRTLKNVQRRLRAFGAGVRRIGMGLTAMATAGILPLVGALKVFGAAGDALDKMSKRTGFSAEALSELGFAAEQSGTDLATLEKGVRTMQRAVNDLERGLSTQVDAFTDLGLSIDDLKGRSPEAQFKLIADRLSKIEDPSKRAALAMMILGRAGTQLLPMLSNGAKGIQALQEEARALGLTISTEAAGDAAELTDTWNRLVRVLKAGAFVIGAALAPTIITMTRAVMRVVIRIADWIKRNRELVVGAAKVLALIGAIGISLIAVGLISAGLAAGLGALATIVSTVGGVLGVVVTVLGALLSPIGLVIAAVVALGVAIMKYTGAGSAALAWLGEKFGKLRDFVGDVVGGIVDALAAGDIALAAKVLWAGLKVAWERGTDGLHRRWINFSSDFQKLAIIAFSGMQKAWIKVRDWFYQNFPKTTAFLATVWNEFSAGVQTAWALAQETVEKGFNELNAMAGGLDVSELNRMTERAINERLIKIDDALEEANKKVKQRAEMTQAERLVEQRKALAEVDEAEQKALAAVDKRRGERLAKAEQELADAKRELDEARAKAAEQRAAGIEEGGAGPAAAQFDELVKRLESAGAAIAGTTKTAVRGTFSVAAIKGLFGESRAADRTADATEQTARNTKRIQQAVESGGLTFT